MKFQISINQKAVVDNKLNLDVIDLCIFDFIKDFAPARVCKKVIIQDESYFLCNWKIIANQLPILGLKTRQSVINRMNKLIAADIIEPSSKNQDMGKALYKFGKNYDLLIYEADLSTSIYTPITESLQVPITESLQNNTIDNNTIEDKEAETVEKKHIWIKDRKTELFKQLSIYKKNNPENYPKAMIFQFASWWTETDRKTLNMKFEDQRYFEVARRLRTWFMKKSDQEVLDMWEQEELINLEDLLDTLL